MIQKVDVVLQFPVGAYFETCLDLLFYKGFLTFLKSLYCVNVTGKCHQCPRNEGCRYYYSTGHCFKEYSGILCHINMFSKRRFVKNEDYTITFFFVGNCSSNLSALKLYYLEYLNQSFHGQFFCVKKIDSSIIENIYEDTSEINIITPIDCVDFFKCYESQLDYYNSNYEMSIQKASYQIDDFKCQEITMPQTKIDGCLLSKKGYIGKMIGQFKNMSFLLMAVGIGKNNCIGMGKYEIKNKLK